MTFCHLKKLDLNWTCCKGKVCNAAWFILCTATKDYIADCWDILSFSRYWRLVKTLFTLKKWIKDFSFQMTPHRVLNNALTTKYLVVPSSFFHLYYDKNREQPTPNIEMQYSYFTYCNLTITCVDLQDQKSCKSQMINCFSFRHTKF